MEVNGAPQLFGSNRSFKISSFAFSRRKKLIQLEGEQMTEFSFLAELSL